MKTSTMLLLVAGGYVAYTLWKKQQAPTGSSTAAVSGQAGAPTGPAVSGPAAATSVDYTSYDEIDFVPVGWGPSWVSIMPGGGRRGGGGGGGGHHHGGGGHRGRH